MKEKTKKPLMQLNPPSEPLTPEQEEVRKAFIDEPEAKKKPVAPADEGKKKELFPWEEPEVNKRIIKQLQVRLPEPDYLLLKYVVDNSRQKSIHSFMMQAIMKEAKKELKKITDSD